MAELIELRRLKSAKQRQSHARSIILKTNETSSDSSDDDSSIQNESSVIITTNLSKRNNKVQRLPVIINTQPFKQKKKHRKHIQQFLINTQPSPRKKEILITPALRYAPVPYPLRSLNTVIENHPLVYQRIHTSTFIDDRPIALYRSCETPVRRLVRVQPSPRKDVHLPKHAKKLVNRFLNGLEHAHGCQHTDGSDSDCSIDDCHVCRRLRLAMDGGKRHEHGYSKSCKVCNLLEKSDFVISTTKKRGKHSYIVESSPSNIKPAIQTRTTTTTTTQPKTVFNPAPAYPAYIDPNTGFAYAYDPNWQYNPSGTYDYSSYYTNPAYIQSNPEYQIDPSNPITTIHNPSMDQATYTHVTSNDKKHKPTNKTVVVHTSRDPAPKNIIEQPHRLHRKNRSTTVLKERTTSTPRKTTTTYIQT